MCGHIALNYVPCMFQFKILQRRAAKTKRAVAWKKQTGYLPIHALDMTSCKTEMPAFFALTSNMACSSKNPIFSLVPHHRVTP